MNFFEFIKTRLFLKHFLLSVFVTAGIVTLVLSGLKWYTHHGEAITVPSLVGLTPGQIAQMETISEFEIIIVDSVYDSKMTRGAVIIQDPVPGAKVKRNRKVYLTTVAVMPEKVSMPDLVDLTLRQATATLETYGLRLGRIKYIPDIAANAVLGQFYKNQSIDPGEEILKGSVIDLNVGQGMGGSRFQVPRLAGKTRDDAHMLIKNAYLTVGDETFENDADPETARVYQQYPAFGRGVLLNAGQPVNLIYRDPAVFDFENYLGTLESDTLAVDDEDHF